MKTQHPMHRFTMAARLLLVCCINAGAAHAQLHPGDIFVGLENGRIVTGRINPNLTVDTSVRAFPATFGDSGFDGFTANPGYDAALVFNPAHRIGFNILSPLQLWNGDGFESVGGETLTFSFLSLSATTNACFVPGFDLAVQSNGGWHRHLSMFLNPVAPATSVASGVYLLKLQLYCTAPGVQSSLPYWLVCRHNASATDHEAAIEWVNEHLVNPTCAADVNGDLAVNVSDLLAVISGWGAASCNPADINDDGWINVSDLLAVISAWGPCP